MDNKKLIPIIIIAILVVGGIGFWYWSQREKESTEIGIIETAKNVSESVPEIQINLGEKVPEINPLDRANPFRYQNPLR